MDMKKGSASSKKQTSTQKKHVFRVKVYKKKLFQANKLKKQAGLANLILNKIDFKSKLIKRDSEKYLNSSREKKFTRMTFQFLASMPQTKGHSSP